MAKKVPYFETGVVAASADRHYSFPCSLSVLPGGLLATTFTGDGGCVSYSEDGGRTWSDPVVLFHNDCPFEVPPGVPQTFADPTFAVFHDRVEIYCVSLVQSDPPFTVLHASRLWRRVSLDGGRTWGPIGEWKTHRKYLSGTTNAALRLSDGSMIYGYSWEVNAESGSYIPDGEGTQIYKCGVLRTVDEGRTWTPGADVFVSVPKGGNSLETAISGSDEPAYAELADGSLYMLVRTGTDRLWEARSADGGRTWSQPAPSQLISHNCPAALLRLQDGDVLVVYNDHPKLRARMCARVSSDGCRTWSEIKVFAPIGFADEPRANYPVACQLDDGMIVVTWGQRRESNASDKQKVCYARFNKEWLTL